MQNTDQFPVRQNESETADYVAHFDANEKHQLVSQGALHYAGQIAAVLSSILLVPLMLLRLGPEAYGFWIVALAAPGFAAGLDNALYLAITRETALHRTTVQISDESTCSFLSACCGAYAVFGLLSAFFVVASGIVITQHLHLSPSVQIAAPTVFASVALAFASGRVVVFGNAVMAGFQRFGTINAISVGVLVLRFFSFVLLLRFHDSLRAIAICYALVAVVECFIVFGFAYRFGAVRANRSLFQWRLLRRVGKFGIASFLTTILQNLFWFSPPILLSFLTGSTSATTLLYAGQRPCFIVSDLNWRGAEVIFSASAAKDEHSGSEAVSSLMLFGTKCVLVVAMPLCIGLFLLAPVLVHVWLRIARPGTEIVMQVTSIGVIADALWVGPLHVLWGRGMARRVFIITAGMTACVLILNFLLVPRLGVPGAALAFTASAWIGAIITTNNAARETGSSWLKFLVSSFSDVAIPSVSLAAFTLAASALLREHPRSLLAVASIGGGIVYAILFWIQQRFRKDRGSSFVWFTGRRGRP
jgi:O-antigen/teichoic acid export membrane protein